MIFAGKAAIQRIVVEDDLLKSPEYEWIRTDPRVSNLMTERDRVAYRQKVTIREALAAFINLLT